MFYSFYRFIQIHFILAKYKIDTLLLPYPILAPLRVLLLIRPKYWKHPFAPNRGAAIRYALQELSPIFVKFGQALATRRDLIPRDIANELAMLQDRVTPFPNARAFAEKLTDKPFDDIFATFDDTPLASASIAQVHAATLKSGEDVVVKIVRPSIKKKILRDIRLMHWLARWCLVVWPRSKKLRPLEIVSEFKRTLKDELDLIREGANAAQLKRNFSDSKKIYIPKVYWDHSNTDLLVLERIYGIPISNHRELKRLGINFKRLAEIGVELFFMQVFRDNFFHADMHAGNIFVSTENPDSPQFIVVDFGIVGTLSTFDKRYLAQNFYAFIQKDYYRVAELHIHSGWVPKHTRVDEFAQAVRAICEPILQRPIREVSCAKLLVRLFDVGRQFDMELLPQLLLMQKTLFAIEGLGRELYPDLDIWTTAKPYIEQWIKRELGMRGLIKTLKNQLPFWTEILPRLPVLLEEKLELDIRTMSHPEPLLQNQSSPFALGLFTGLFLGVSIIYFHYYV